MNDLPILPKVVKPNVSSPWGKPKPQMLYFFEREDGSYISVPEQEAWTICSGKIQKIGPVTAPLKFIGRSDSRLYMASIKEAHILLKEKGQAMGLELAQQKMRDGLQAEFEEAKKNKVFPRNFDVTDRAGNPINLNTYGQI